MSRRSWLAIGALLLLGSQAGCSCGTPTTAVVVIEDAGEDVYVPPPVTCDNAQLIQGCTSGRCTITSPISPLPQSTILQLAEKPLPSDLQGDTVAPYLCSVGLPQGTVSNPQLTLSMALSATADPADVLFEYGEAVAPSQQVGISGPDQQAVVGLITVSGDFGATKKPIPWSIEGYAGQDVASSADEPSLLRNLSSGGMTAAFYDGTRLYVGNGSRILVYNGLPANPGVKPDVVLGQPDLDTTLPGTTSSLSSGASAIWSDGTRIVAASGNRVLIWNQIPTANFTPADVVLGQPDFSSNAANNGGVSAQSLFFPSSVTSDGTRLIVADTLNQRLLEWATFPVLVDQPADFVLGQPNFSSNAAGAGAVPFNQPWGAALTSAGLFASGQFGPGIVHFSSISANNPSSDYTALPDSYTLSPPSAVYTAGRISVTPSGGLAVRDAYNGRIAMMRSLPSGPASIDFVLGQEEPTYIAEHPTSASSVPTPESGLGGGSVFVVPQGRRVLVFDDAPSYAFEPASRVVGQAGFTTDERTDYRGISASTLALPRDAALGGGLLAVADAGNNRVLLFKTSELANDKLAASVVVGQPDATSYVPNLDQRTPSATTLSGPSGVALDGTHLIVADTENHRVLIWNTVPTSNGTAADVVLGQTDFTGRRPNSGRGDANLDGFSDAAADGFFYPTGVASDGTHLFVADRLNNRVLGWSTFPTANATAADIVLGQPDFVTVRASRGNGGFTVAADGFNLPTGVTLVGTSLWVADTENNRLVRWDTVTTTPTAAAWVGQPSGAEVTNANYEQPNQTNVGFPQPQSTATASILRPRAIAFAGTTLYVSETDSNRVHMLDGTSFAPLGELGQAQDSDGTPNTNGVTAATMALPLGLASDGSQLWVADSRNHRVLGFAVSTLPSTGATAGIIVGQTSPSSAGFNQSSDAFGSVTSQPRGLALANGQLYVCDSNHHRVLVLKAPPASGDIPVRVYGQPDDALALANSGGAPSASTLDAPRGIYADATHLVIADTGNNRVLLYDPTAQSAAAQVVLGQTSFTSATANAGGASLSTMQAPSGVYSDGSRLYVADTGNHRVLVWNSFPTQDGQAADFVLGQTSPSGILSNLGGAAPSAATLSFPAAFAEAYGALYIADSGNNRIVRYSTPPSISGAPADGVLGQTDLVSRTAASFADDLSKLAGPVGLAFDGTNLYVSDRDLGRVVIFRMGVPAGGGTPFLALGASGQGLSLSGPGGVAVERTPYFTSRVYIADTGDDQVALIGSVSRLITSEP